MTIAIKMKIKVKILNLNALKIMSLRDHGLKIDIKNYDKVNYLHFNDNCNNWWWVLMQYMIMANVY